MALLGVQEPRLSHVPAGDAARGDQAVEFARWCGLTLYPWQEELLRDMCRSDSEGNWAAREAVVIVPRQNGKGEVLLARELAGIYLFGERLIGHSAHFMDTAQEAQERLWEVIEGNEALFYWWEDDPSTPGVPRFGRTNGKENISFPTGQKILFRTRTDKTFRGLSIDLVIFDECFNLPNEINAAMSKTTRARERAQRVYISSPVDRMVHYHGAIFSAKRWAGIDGADGVLFKEWSPADEADIFDESTWAACNPSMVDRGAGAQLSDIKGDAAAAKNSEILRRQFMVESLGWGDWYPRDGDEEERELLTDLDTWADARRIPREVGESCVGIDVAPDGDGVGFVAAVQSGDEIFLSLSPLSEFSRGEMIDAVGRAVERNDPLGVVVDPIGQASTLINGLEKIEVDPVRLTGSKVSAAYELFIRLVAEKKIIHDGDPRWVEAWEVAAEKPGKYRCLYRNDPKVSPLVAASFAVWGLQELALPVEVKVETTRRFVGHARPVRARGRAEKMEF